MREFIEKFHEIPLFDQIDEKDILSALNCIGGYVKKFEAEHFIILDGGDVECVGCVISGLVHMIKEDAWGGRTILAVIEPSQVFGETYVFGDSSKASVSFVAAKDSEILFLPFKRVLHTCSKSCEYHQKLVDNMVSLIAQKNLRLTDKLEITTKRSLRAKILTYLSQESQRSKSKYFTVPLGRLEMADYLCVDRSALTRELSRMRDEGILDFSNNTFRLFDN